MSSPRKWFCRASIHWLGHSISSGSKLSLTGLSWKISFWSAVCHQTLWPSKRNTHPLSITSKVSPGLDNTMPTGLCWIILLKSLLSTPQHPTVTHQSRIFGTNWWLIISNSLSHFDFLCHLLTGDEVQLSMNNPHVGTSRRLTYHHKRCPIRIR